MEAITRQLLSLPKKPVIIYNYVGIGTEHIANTDADNNRIGRLVMPRPCKELHEEVAQKYGIPSINIDSYIQNIMVNGAAALDGKTYTQNEIYSSTDCVHPNTSVGTRLYADYMIDTVSKNPQKYLCPADTSVSGIEKYENNIYDETFHTIPYTESVLSGSGWRETTYNSRPHLKTEVQGDSLSFDFTGNVLYLRGARVDGSFNIKITNADSEGNTLEKTVSTVSNSARADVIYTNTALAAGEHTVTITRNSGTVAINGISVNGEIPEEGFATAESFREKYADILSASIGGFSHTFDDLTSVVDSGWTKDDEVTWEVADGKLSLKGTKDKGIYHKVEDNSYDIIYMGFDLTIPATTGIRIWNTASNKEVLGMIYGNPAGVFVRDAAGTAARFMSSDKWWPSLGEHRFELILNYKNNDFKFYIDGVEAQYTNGQSSAQGGITLDGSSLGDIKIVLSQDTSTPVYLDNFDFMGYDAYISQEILKLSAYEQNAEEKVALLEARAEYLETNGKPVNADAKAKLAEIKKELEDIQTREGTLTPSENNTNLKDTAALFTYACQDIAEIKIGSRTLEEGTDYSINGNKILFEGTCFNEAGNYYIETTDSAGTKYLDIVTVREPEVQMFPIFKSSDVLADGITAEGDNRFGTNSAITGYSGNSNLVYQAYKAVDASHPDPKDYAVITYEGREEFKGMYRVEWFDVDGTINGKQYAMPTLNAEIKSAGGVSSFSFNAARDNTWNNLGVYSFNGTEDEYIKIKNGVTLGIDAGKRFFGEIIRLTEASDERILYNEFADLPEEIVISESKNNVPYVNTARIINLSEDIDERYIDRIDINGTAVGFEKRGEKIFISEKEFAQAGDYAVKAVLINGAESNTLSFTLENPERIDYKLSQGEKSEGVLSAATAGTNHSRHGEAPTKVTVSDIAAMPEGTALDDYVYVKWDIGNIKEGDYLIDTWLNSGRLALECKAEVSYNGGADKKLYRSINSNSNSTDSYITEFYLGNGDKIHFTGTGDEYIKIMLDDDWEELAGASKYFIIDSFRLTEYYDMNAVYDEFYGKDVISMTEPEVSVNQGVDEQGNPGTVRVLSSVLSVKYPMNKYGYTAYLAVYDSEGRLTNVVKKKNIMIYNGEKEFSLRFNLDMAKIDLTDKTYKVFLWGGDAEPENDTSLTPYL